MVGVAALLMPMQSSRTMITPPHGDAGDMARQLAQQLAQKLARQLARQCTNRRAPQLKKQLAQRQGKWPRNHQKSAAMQRARKIPTQPYGLLRG
jgi:hypothetical protein